MAGGGVVSVPVTLDATAAAAQFSVAPQSLSFAYRLGDPGLASQSLSLSSQPSGSQFSISASAANWLSISATSGTSPSIIAVSVDATKFTTTGAYSGTVTITPPGGKSVINIPVSVVVSAAAPPSIAISPLSQTLNATQGGSAAAGQFTVSNTGGGTLQFTSAVSSDAAAWLKLTGSGSGAVKPRAPGTVGFAADPANLAPGTYSGIILVSEPNASQAPVTVTLVVSASSAGRLELSQLGLTFNAVVNGLAPASRHFAVANAGSGTLPWTVTVNGSWLRAGSGGSSVAGQPGVPVNVSVVPGGLAAGQYYGSIGIVPGGPGGTTQYVSVVLNVAASSAAVRPAISTGGVVFQGTAGGTTPLSQTISVINGGNSNIGFSAVSGSSWLTVSPAGGSLPPGTTQLQVQADFRNLNSGVESGSILFSFDDGSVATMQAIVIASSVAHAIPGTLRPRAVAACSNGKAGYLIPVLQQPVSGQRLQVSVAQTVSVLVIDDCGANVTAKNGAAVRIGFSTGEAGIDLRDTGNGIWEGTWTPSVAATSEVVVASAVQQTLTSPASAFTASQATVVVLAATASSAPQPVGIVNAASGAQAIPQLVSPGSYVAIYGNALAGTGAPSATSLPLPVDLNGTRLTLGGKPMPLLYAGAGQVNALIPNDLAPNATYQLIVTRGSAISVPVPLTVAKLQPGIYTVNQSGSGPGIVTIAATGSLAQTTGQPAKASDFLVVYCTGLGLVQGENGEAGPSTGDAAPSDKIFRTTATVQAMINGLNAPVVFSGLTPSLAGLYQVNVQVPSGLTPTDNAQLVISVKDPETGALIQSNAVTIAVR